MGADLSELQQVHARIKRLACPHCGAVGFLNAHGFLRGYAENGTGVLRGRRWYCSRRRRRRGCGRTVSVLLTAFLAGFIVLAQTLFSFASRVAAGESKRVAWERVSPLSQSTGYRLWNALRRAMPTLRSRLFALAPEPPACNAIEPVAQMLLHCTTAFPDAPEPFAALQWHSQAHLLR